MQTKNQNQSGITWIQLWRQNDWGQYMRRNEVFSHKLASYNYTQAVIHVEEISIKAFALRFLGIFTKDKNQRSGNVLHIRKAISPRQIKISEKLFVASVVTIGLNHKAWIAAIYVYLIRLQLFLKVKVSHPTVLILYPPSLLNSVGMRCIKYDFLLVDLIDDVIARARNEKQKKFYIENYKLILPFANKIIATGESLRSYQGHTDTEIEILTNGVNISMYNRASYSRNKIRSKKSKIVGYVGSINSAFDANLIVACLNSHPNVDFVAYGFYDSVGKSKIDLLDTFKNFYFCGPLAPLDVPQFLMTCEVLIMPKILNNATKGNDSMKVYQYLATGKPIVTTSVQPAPRFSQLLYIADDAQSFSNLLTTALNENNDQLADDRKRAAEGSSWDKKIDDLVTKVISELGKTNKSTDFSLGC